MIASGAGIKTAKTAMLLKPNGSPLNSDLPGCKGAW